MNKPAALSSTPLFAAISLLLAMTSACVGAGVLLDDDETTTSSDSSDADGGLGDDDDLSEARTGIDEITTEMPETTDVAFNYPFAKMGWHQANRDGFTESQIASLTEHEYEMVVIPKMHRAHLDDSYFDSIKWERDNSTWWNNQTKIFGYINAHYSCQRYGIPGKPISGFSTAGGNNSDCNRTWSKNNPDAREYVDAVLQEIQDSGANGVFIDFPWQGQDGDLGVLAGYIIQAATTLFGDGNVVINVNSKDTADAVALEAQSTWVAKIEKAGPDFFPARDDEKNHELVNDVIEYLAAIPNLESIEVQSKWCDPNVPYDPSTITGNWHFLNYYQANACADQGTDCIYLCTRGNGCEGATDEEFTCDSFDNERLLGEVLTNTSYWPGDDPYSEIVSLGDSYSVTKVGVRTDWWKKRPNMITVYNWSPGHQGEVIATENFMSYESKVCGYDLMSDCSWPGEYGSDVGELQVEFGATIASAVKVVAEGLLDPANHYTLIMGARVYGT